MEKIILKHLTVTGFAKGVDLSKCEVLEKKLENAQNKLVTAQKEVAEAKEKLSKAVEESLRILEAKEKEIKSNEGVGPKKTDASEFGFEDIKLKYNKAITELEAKNNEIQKKLSEYRSDGTENWNTFKHKLNHDLEELGKALRGIITQAK